MRLRTISPLLLSLALIFIACSKDAQPPPAQSPGQVHEPSPDNAELIDPARGKPTTGSNEPGQRLQLGIDGDPGYTQTEVEPAELAAASAAGTRSPEPTDAEQPTTPSNAEQPSEPSSTSDSNDSVYGYGLRDARYLERERERERERARVEDAHEPGPVDEPRDEPHEPVHVSPHRGVPRR